MKSPSLQETDGYGLGNMANLGLGFNGTFKQTT